MPWKIGFAFNIQWLNLRLIQKSESTTRSQEGIEKKKEKISENGIK